MWRATARALAELGPGAFFVGGVTWAMLGAQAPWFVLAVVAVSMMLRAADVEARALFVRGGLYGSVRETLGPVAARAAAAALLVDRLVLGVLAAVLVGHYSITVSRSLAGARIATLSGDTAPLIIGASLIGLVWWLQRQGRDLQDHTVARLIGAAVAVLGVFVIVGAISAARVTSIHDLLTATLPWRLAAIGGRPLELPRTFLLIAAMGFAMPALGGVAALGIAALDLEQPRIRNLRRMTRLVSAYALVITTVLTFIGVAVIPSSELGSSRFAPLADIARHLPLPGWVRFVFLVAIAGTACIFLTATVRSTSSAAHGVLTRLVDDGTLPDQWRTPHPRFGTAFRIVDATAFVQLGIVLLAGGDVTWLARLYAFGVVISAVLKVTALVRYRFVRPEPRAFEVPLNVTIGGATWPLGLMVTVVLIGIPALGLLFVLDPPSLAASALIGTLTLMLSASARTTSESRPEGAAPAADPFQLLPADDVNLWQVQARPGSFLVPVRKPHTLTHLTAAFRAAGDRDVVAMTVRLVGVDVPEDPAIDPQVTDDERRLLSAVIAAAEREGRRVRLMIVPGVNVFDSLVDTALRLRSSEIHVGESETLSADDQARLLGEAWERAEKPSDLDLRLVVHHPRGGAAAYHLGAHAPALRPEDFEQIHRLWLDVVRAVGPRVHHRDVVRAALMHMEQDLNGPNRDGVLQILRDTARPADEIAGMIRERDFGRLRDALRNRASSDLAAVLGDLSLDEQVLVFRILPRKNAADTFAYLSLEQQNTLLKAMASEEAASLLNAMAPDDRTTFLEELPADATRQLLALLTPEERAVAVRLLGYPEGSIGRLMTPHYIAVREQWTVNEVLEYVRSHGQDSETLNVIYVVDDNGALIDDIRISRILIAGPNATVRSLMDRRYVALKATDDQETAVRVFRAEDRVALPVTDTSGVLIGIVTVDDMLDVAEQAATEDIQRLGGSEALDKPYMEMEFRRMVQKRAGWLTALFLGEMLTATAMGAFQHEIERAVVLALFVPLIISSGGNSGSQASTLIIRALALGEVTLNDWWLVMRREIGAGLALGGILGAIGFLRITTWSAFSSIYGEHWLLVAITVAFALVGVVLWGTLVGSLLPFGLRRLGFDPAASSAPFVATLVDVTGLIIYFSVGMIVLRGTLL